MKISESEMREKYHLKNNLIIRYLNKRVFNNGEDGQYDFNEHKRVLESLCCGDKEEFDKAIVCLEDGGREQNDSI